MSLPSERMFRELQRYRDTVRGMPLRSGDVREQRQMIRGVSQQMLQNAMKAQRMHKKSLQRQASIRKSLKDLTRSQSISPKSPTSPKEFLSASLRSYATPERVRPTRIPKSSPLKPMRTLTYKLGKSRKVSRKVGKSRKVSRKSRKVSRKSPKNSRKLGKSRKH